jgi:capping protein alpha
MGEPTEEELIDIANNFLLSSPPGEFLEVVTDVRALLPRENLLNDSAPRVFKEYNTEQMIQVESPNHNHKVLISKYGELSDNEYLDPKGNQVIQFDHIKQEVKGTRAIGSDDIESGLESLRAAFEKHAFEYVQNHYPHGTTTVYAKDGAIVVAISAARFNSNNFWNGRWRSVWTFSGGDLTGHLKICVHYYEEGNVQLNTDTTQKLSSPEQSNVDATASAAVKAIQKAEQSFQQSLDQSYSTMGDTTFKALRRKLPINQSKIDWNKIRLHKIGSEMSSK